MSPGLHTVCVEVNDSVGVRATSNTATAVIIIHGHDITITNVTIGYLACSKTIVGQNQNVKLYVIVVNLGNYTEAFNATASIRGSSMITQYINSSIMHTPLSSGSYTAITFAWNTAGFAYGNYTISASVTPAPGETNNGTGEFTYGIVTVTIPGDANGDGHVDFGDLTLLGLSWWTGPSSPYWNPNCDFDASGFVDFGDLTILGLNWWTSWS
jgi:hypothetical protein